MKIPIKKVLISFVLVTSVFTLTACGGADRLVKEAEKVTQENEVAQKSEQEEREKDYEAKVKEWQEMYAKYGEQTREETLEKISKRPVGPVNDDPIVVKEAYTEPDEFARFASDILFNFHRGDISAEDYVVFLENYGSENMKGLLLTGDRDTDVNLMNSIQSRIRDQGIHYKSYEISKVQTVGKTGVFYRKLITSTGLQEFYKTELTKKGDYWYIDNDELSDPVAFE